MIVVQADGTVRTRARGGAPLEVVQLASGGLVTRSKGAGMVDTASTGRGVLARISKASMGTTLQVWRGFDTVIEYTVEERPGVPKLLFGQFNAVAIDFDDREGAADKLSISGTIEDNGTELLRGKCTFPVARAQTVGWEGDARIRYQVRCRANDGKWYPCGGPDPVAVHDRVADDNVF